MRASFFFILLLLVACSSDPPIEGEYIYRKSGEHFYRPDSTAYRTRALYPWEQSYVGNHPRITREFFRCKGSHCNPVRLIEEGEQTVRLCDCDGHGLPQRGGEPYIAQVLIDLLNYIQEETGSRVVITCGHRCPAHNRYSDPRPFNQTSKHMIGAEADFYVQGMEGEPESIIELIQEFCPDAPFERYYKENTDVSTPPWYNRELFVKLYREDEGRDLDNRHPYPYIGVQVRYDRDLEERVVYSWERARAYFR